MWLLRDLSSSISTTRVIGLSPLRPSIRQKVEEIEIKIEKPIKVAKESPHRESKEPAKEPLKLDFIVLSSIQAKGICKEKKGLKFANVIVMGKSTKTFVDIRVSNLFVSEKDVKKLRLKFNKEVGRTRIVNSKQVLTLRVAQGMGMQLGDFQGKDSIK
ncbi:hypothetical protein GOBAR_DD01520 [Gossypium barbadense]|nr:hypothetical protein GOBAR_DD01520 [Gossypium barbadense]